MKTSALLESDTAEQLKKSYRKTLQRSRRRLAKYGLLGANVVIVLAVGLFVVFGGRKDSTLPDLSFASAVSGTTATDELSAADIAANVALQARLEEATSVKNQAESFRAELSVVPADTLIVAKPQLVVGGDSSKSYRDIVQYTVQAGETIPSIAAKFNITSDSIRWSNGISGDLIAEGRSLWIPPRNGIVYEVKQGDTIDSIASRYQANKEQLTAFNDAEINGLPVGTRILIPDGKLPVAAPARRSVSTGFSFGIAPIYGSNGYSRGYCTWHAANRRIEIGKPLPSNLGNAITWFRLAQAAGLATGSEPQAGAVAWHRNIGGLGHVAFVERVNEDGSMVLSDMNYPYWGRVTTRTVPRSEFGNYGFIY